MKININDLFDFSDLGDFNKVEKKVKDLDALLSKFSDNLQKNVDKNIQTLDKWGKQLDTLNVSIEKEASLIIQLEKSISSLTQEQLKLLSQQEKVTTARNQTTESAKKAKESLTELEKAEKKLAQATGEDAEELAKLRIQLAQANQQTKQNAKESLGLVSAYDKLAQEAAEAKKEAKALGAALGTESLQFQVASKRADALNQKLKDIDAGVGDFQRNVGNYSSALDGVKQGFSSVLELATPVGLAVAAVGLAIEGVGNLAETVKETNTQLKETAQLTNLSGNALTEYTAQVRTTSKVFDKDYKEVLIASNVLQKEFGIKGKEAIDLINQGFIQGNDINGDYLDQLKEYSTQFKQAGLDAQNLNQIISLGAKEGIFNDKAVDTVKEGGLRLREFTKATSDALIPLGKLRNEQIKQAVASGNSFKAIQLVSKGLKEVKLSAEQTQGIITNVFGGPGEDAGLRFIQLLSDIDTGQKNVLDNLTEQQKQQLKILEVEQELAKVEVELGNAFKGVGNDFTLLSKQLQTLGIEGVLYIIDELKKTFNELAEPFEAVSTQIDELGKRFEGGGDGILSFIKKFNPVTFALKQFEFAVKVTLFVFEQLLNFINDSIDAFNYVSKAVKDFATSFEVVNTFIEAAKTQFTSLVNFFAQTPQFLNGLVFAFKEAFNQIGTFAKNVFLGVGEQIQGVLTLDVAKIKSGTEKIKVQSFQSGKAVGDAFTKGFNETAKVTVTGPKKDEEIKKVTEEVKKVEATKTPKKDKDKKSKEDLLKEQIDKEQKIVDEEAKKAQLKAIENRNNDLISEEEYQNELLIIEARRIEQSIQLREKAGVDAIEQEKALQELLLAEKKKGEAEGLKQEEEAKKKELEIDKKAEEEKKKLQEQADKDEADRRKKQQEKLAEPIAQAGLDALETRIQSELVLAGVRAFRASLERGDETQKALQEGLKAVAAAQVFKSLAKNQKGFHDGGYTGEGNEYEIAGVVHKGEFVNTKKQVSKYGMGGWKATDFDKAVEVGHFNQFAKIDGIIEKETNLQKQIIVTNNNKLLIEAINELPSKMPHTDLSFYGKELQQRTKQGNITRKTIYKGIR